MRNNGAVRPAEAVADPAADRAADPEEAAHYPDHRFVRLCFERHGLNKGIYNAIDEWFYDRGWTDIAERRKLILRFLEQTDPKRDDSEFAARRFLKFGKGQLVHTLEKFARHAPAPAGIVKRPAADA
ncbi:hypothetical protein [Paenibacillus flagellatus]|uniref:hypothetical protein n=1 Tax=Paenibacillus flagellatus TaxID=2211139 RepID=UPI001B880029|nr:hypothetical protein [Paenibacillus flagellatus]